MRVEIRKNGLTIDRQAEKAISRKTKKLEHLLEKFQPDMVHLRIDLEHLNKKNLYLSRLILEFPQKTLRAEKQGNNLTKAINESFNSLFREVNKFKSFLRHEPEYKRKLRPNHKEMLLATRTPEELHEVYLDFVEKNFGRFYNFAFREIRNRIYQGRLKPGEVQVRDVLDEAVVKVWDEVPGKFDEKQIRKKIYRKIVDIVDRRVRERKLFAVPLERKVEIRDLDTELYEFYQPDDIVRLEDVVPDPNAEEPEEWFEEEKIEETVDRVISLLPNRWRQALQLVEMEDFSPEEVSMIQEVPVETVKEEVELAKRFIREKLQDFGLQWTL